MKQITRIGIFLFTILVCTSPVHATDYNYLPPDVVIKQNEALSALEYRLQTLETLIANNPEVSVNTIDARIKALEIERDTEKRYVTGLYGSYGIGNQLDAKLAEIDAKYDAQIAELEDEKDGYQSQASDLAKAEKEAEQLRQQIIELQKKNIAQSEEYLDLLDEQSNSDTEVYTDTDIYEGFMYMDSLPLTEASAFFGRVKASRPDVALRITALYSSKYPNGKPGTAIHDEYLESLPKEVSDVPQMSKSVVSPEVAIPITETLTQATDTPIAETPVVQEVPVPELIQESFVDKVVSFFKRLAFWR